MIYEITSVQLVVYGLFFSLIGIVTGWFLCKKKDTQTDRGVKDD